MIEPKKIGDYKWVVPTTAKPGMQVPVVFYASEGMMKKLHEDRTLDQAINTTFMRGVTKQVSILPDFHEGYASPIGCCFATDYDNGVISPGATGYDINCSVRLLRTDLNENEVKPVLRELVELIFRNVPSGVGAHSKLRLSIPELDEVLERGVQWAVDRGYGWKKDLEVCEEGGYMKGAKASAVSSKAKQRGAPEIGTLGSGNHYLEIQRVDKIFLPNIAKVMGIENEGQVTVLIHCGSRGLGHQICTDYIRILEPLISKYGIKLPDREFVCAPAHSKEAQDYYGAACAAVNYSLTNKQVIAHWTRECFEKVFNKSAEDLGMDTVYDVGHNTVRLEEHKVDEKVRKLWIHRKGSTRAFPSNHPLVPEKYKDIGQPVLIGGSMGTASYVLVGTEKGEETFYTSCHGSGRVMSRARAMRGERGENVKRDLERRGILVRSASWRTLSEEADFAYKNVTEVVEACEKAGISKIVCRMKPLGCIKG